MQLHLLPPSILPLFLLLVFHAPTSSSQDDKYLSTECAPFNFPCGGRTYEIRYPFLVEGRSQSCAFPGYDFFCEENTLTMNISSVLYNVKTIDYENNTLTVVKRDFLNQSCPITDTMIANTYYNISKEAQNLTLYYNCLEILTLPPGFYKLPCFRASNLSAYFTLETGLGLPAGFGDCSTSVMQIQPSEEDRLKEEPNSFAEVLQEGFDAMWTIGTRWCKQCVDSGGRCGYDPLSPAQPTCYCRDGVHMTYCPGESGNDKARRRRIKIIIGVCAGTGSFFLLCLLLFCSKVCLENPISFCRRKVKDEENVEAFLKNYGSLIPKRYQYSELKNITNSFEDKLGQGGYGSVFKGNLSDGRLVAVKVLDQSKGSGEEFINEVASIGRTYHVNVVALLGFCFRGSKRALVYEFMPNGSLERFIYSEKQRKNHPLGWQKLSEIAVGIARGLEYLHRGCSTRILHFDIKPHNILLDKDFCPKISDFGLAKLCPSKESIISLLGARGTIGYIAPEVYCRNFGGVSSKSDVYSYGMMVLEMVGGRRNIDAGAENTSEIYFPDWIYNRLDRPRDLGLHEITAEAEEEIARKMIVVGLWCIQTDPRDRPSMGRVVEMLEGSLANLSVPPKPFLSSPTRPNQESSTSSLS